MGELITPKPGDTKISEIIYGIDIVVTVNGGPKYRHYSKIYCQDPDCGSLILAKYIPCKTYGYAIVGDKRHNNTMFCCDECRNKYKSEQLTLSKKSAGYTTKKKGYPVIKATKRQRLVMTVFIASIGKPAGYYYA